MPGWGFDWTIFQNWIDQYEGKLQNLCGHISRISETPRHLPMPEDSASFKDLNWTNGIVAGIRQLMKNENISNPILVSYFTYSNIIAMRLALDYPQEIGQVIVLSGMAKYTNNYPAYEPRNLEQRIGFVERFLAPQWFKTVSKKTWDDGNFHPKTFTKDTIQSAKYWDMMSSVPIPTMVRYLCEYYCTDLSLEYEKLTVPTLAVLPSFTQDLLSNPKNSYLPVFFHHSWIGARPSSDSISIVTLTDTNAFITEDQPEKLYSLIDEFLNQELNLFKVVR